MTEIVSSLMAPSPRRPASLLWLGLSLSIFMMGLALIGPYALTVDPNKQTLAKAFSGPSADYLLGADQLGRSVAARIVAGARVSLGLAFIGMLAAIISGAICGMVSAWREGAVCALILRLADIVIAYPTMLFVILVSGLFGGGVIPIVIGLCLAQWPKFTRLSYVVARQELSADHVEAARLLGFPATYILRRHVLPGMLPYLASAGALTLGANVLTISTIGFLGVGLRPPTAEWGAMIAESISYIRTAPHIVIAPAVALLISTLAATMVGESIAAPVFSENEITQ